MSYFTVIVIFAAVIAITMGVIFVEQGQRRITISFAKRQQGRQAYTAQSSHLPLKLNIAGVIPAIFAQAIILFPGTIATFAGTGEGMGWLKELGAYLSPGQPAYMILFGASIIFFCFFYSALVFNARDTADNLKRQGAFIPGIRPGEQTARYIDGVMTRLTVIGSIYLAVVCLLPDMAASRLSIPFALGGAGLLIVVVVVMDFMSQLYAHLMSHQYESLMKKANFKGTGPDSQ